MSNLTRNWADKVYNRSAAQPITTTVTVRTCMADDVELFLFSCKLTRCY